MSNRRNFKAIIKDGKVQVDGKIERQLTNGNWLAVIPTIGRVEIKTEDFYPLADVEALNHDCYVDNNYDVDIWHDISNMQHMSKEDYIAWEREVLADGGDWENITTSIDTILVRIY